MGAHRPQTFPFIRNYRNVIYLAKANGGEGGFRTHASVDEGLVPDVRHLLKSAAINARSDSCLAFAASHRNTVATTVASMSSRTLPASLSPVPPNLAGNGILHGSRSGRFDSRVPTWEYAGCCVQSD